MKIPLHRSFLFWLLFLDHNRIESVPLWESSALMNTGYEAVWASQWLPVSKISRFPSPETHIPYTMHNKDKKISHYSYLQSAHQYFNFPNVSPIEKRYQWWHTITSPPSEVISNCDRKDCYVGCRLGLLGGGRCSQGGCICYMAFADPDGYPTTFFYNEDYIWYELSSEEKKKILDVVNGGVPLETSTRKTSTTTKKTSYSTSKPLYSTSKPLSSTSKPYFSTKVTPSTSSKAPFISSTKSSYSSSTKSSSKPKVTSNPRSTTSSWFDLESSSKSDDWLFDDDEEEEEEEYFGDEYDDDDDDEEHTNDN